MYKNHGPAIVILSFHIDWKQVEDLTGVAFPAAAAVSRFLRIPVAFGALPVHCAISGRDAWGIDNNRQCLCYGS